MTIRTRLTLWYSGLLATIIIVFGISLFSIMNWAWKSQVRDNMLLVAQEAYNVDPISGDVAVHIPDGLDLIPYYPIGIQVHQADGQLVATSSNIVNFKQALDQTALKVTETTTHDLYVSNTHSIVVTVPIIRPNGSFAGTVQVLSTLSTIDAATDRLFKLMLGVGIVALILAFMMGTVIAGQALQPIEVISHAATQITAAGDLSKRIPYSGPPDELGQLTTTFNATLERLERLFLMQRRFVADVSHELRTPLTTIQGNLDLIKRFGNDPMSMEAIDSEAKRMTRLVGDLLLLAQADSGRLPLNENDVDLGTIVLDVYKQGLILAKEVTLELGGIDAAVVKGDSDRLKQLVLNLVSNAIKYTKAGGNIRISVKEENGSAFIRVKDTGIGIPPEDLDSVFERFYRVDKARSRDMGGTGLGLSIARWIAEAHKGKIWAESELGKGSTFIVQLPLLNADITPPSVVEVRSRMPAIRLPRPVKAKNGAHDEGEQNDEQSLAAMHNSRPARPERGDHPSVEDDRPAGTSH